MQDSLATRVGVEADAYVNGTVDAVALDTLIDHAYTQFKLEIEEQGSRLARDWLRRVIRQHLQNHDTSEQSVLPGFDLPRVITTHENESGEVVYVATRTATRDQWHAHRPLKEMNITRAMAELVKYDDLTDQLNSVWTHHPEWTVGEVIDHLTATAHA